MLGKQLVGKVDSFALFLNSIVFISLLVVIVDNWSSQCRLNHYIAGVVILILLRIHHQNLLVLSN